MHPIINVVAYVMGRPTTFFLLEFVCPIINVHHSVHVAPNSRRFRIRVFLIVVLLPLAVVFHFLTLQTTPCDSTLFCVNVNKLACRGMIAWSFFSSFLLSSCPRTFMGWCRNHPIKCDLGTTNFSAKMQSSFLLRMREHGKGKCELAYFIIRMCFVCARYKVNLI